MRYALLSDIHGRRRKLRAVLADARRRKAERLVSLGDVGGDECLALLRDAGAWAVFGNYEVSGWRSLAPDHQEWVRGWPPILAEGDFLAVHAAPWWPEQLQSVEESGVWLKETGESWRALFPYLIEDELHLWDSVQVLESAGRRVLFHGHTHLQTVWDYSPRGGMVRVQTGSVDVQDGHKVVVGVGSVGIPEDGGWAAYTLYDAVSGRIELIRLSLLDHVNAR